MCAEVTRQGDGFEVAAELIAEGLRLDKGEVQSLMRQGAITSRCERGEGEHAGRWRLSFLYGGKTFRLTVDDAGQVLSRSSFGAGTAT